MVDTVKYLYLIQRNSSGCYSETVVGDTIGQLGGYNNTVVVDTGKQLYLIQLQWWLIQCNSCGWSNSTVVFDTVRLFW